MKEKEFHKSLTIHRAFDVLNLLAANRKGLSFTVLKTTMDNMPSPTLSRLLKYLMADELVVKTTKGDYAIGTAFLELARKTLNGYTLGEIIHPFVVELAETTGQSAAYAELTENAFVLRSKYEQPGSFHYIALNEQSPYIYENGFGMVCLAYQDTETIERMLDGVIPDYTQEQRHELYEELARIKEDGCHVFRYDELLLKRIIAPVFFSDTKTFAGAIGVTMIMRSLTEEERTHYCKCVTRIADKISHIITAPEA
jgi:DNA-binding IclR family transcriptional regulator